MAICATAPGEWRHLAKIPELKDFGSRRRLVYLCETGVFKAKKIGVSWFLHRDEIARIVTPETTTTATDKNA